MSDAVRATATQYREQGSRVPTLVQAATTVQLTETEAGLTEKEREERGGMELQQSLASWTPDSCFAHINKPVDSHPEVLIALKLLKSMNKMTAWLCKSPSLSNGKLDERLDMVFCKHRTSINISPEAFNNN